MRLKRSIGNSELDDRLHHAVYMIPFKPGMQTTCSGLISTMIGVLLCSYGMHHVPRTYWHFPGNVIDVSFDEPGFLDSSSTL